MKKKDTLKNTKPVEQNPVSENGKKPATPNKQKLGSEIDEIFAGKKRKKPEKVAITENVLGEPKKSMKKKRKDNKVCKENGSVSGVRSRKKTGDGLTIYTEEELGIGRADAGGTPLCPFDCDCCF